MPSPNIFRTARGENRIFRDEGALLPDYLPEELPGREREVKELAYCLQPSSEGRQPEHALFFGPPGTGKTSVARLVLKHLSEYSQRPLPLYVNCWESPTRFAILSSLVDRLGEPMPRRGISSDEIFARIVEIAKKEGKIPVVVLDEADRLDASEGGVQVLYDLCRAGELHSLKTGVVAITNDEEFHLRLDARVRSSFVQHTFKFSSYGVPQMKEILFARAKKAFFDGVLSDDVVPLCAAIAVKRNGDARVALMLLRAAGKLAERENAERVEVKHVRSSQDGALLSATSKAERKMGQLDELDQIIVSMVREAGKNGIESGKLYAALSGTVKERALRQRIDKLEKNGVLVAEEVRLGKGRSRMIKAK